MTKVLNKYAAITILGAVIGLAACEDQVGLDANTNASLSFAANGGSTLLGDPMPPQNPMTVSGHVIAITRVELRLSELELEGGDSAEMEMRGAQILVALPMNGSVVTPINATVAAGTYTELEMKVQS